ncbi:rhomboid family intramembrane serine protease [Marinobacterium lutimaris]|uniref:Membrane associated serine protease, rhomboid family n=1 Tax=Marinobacterium lutimaris TaxID=568106 RepID=A0A1H5Z779_9GAMM|nr:rhomboid family intramembrane serine protease [Marinobacterium lutimaris]SEG32004.1 Membrane associated serine protease, rhomboid family [Marinobacterium lutimaris]
MKYCPYCRHQALRETTYQGQEIDVCPRCAGLWFEAGEFDAILDLEKDSSIELKRRDAHAKTDLPCPDCGSAMHRHHLMQGYRIEIECCPHGHGSWIERAELAEAKAAKALNTPLETLNAGINWRTWLFQFVTQMPVEYNITPHNRPWVTWSLLLLNTLIFAAMMFVPQIEEAMFYWAMIPNDISHGSHLGTLISSQFLHGSWLHLLSNMYFLWLTGDNLEDALGHVRFLLIYLLCGTFAALAQAMTDPSSTIPVIGASGAIAGLFGLYLFWFRKASLTLMIFVFQKKVAPWVFFLIWLGLNLIGMISGDQGVAYMAHIGGLVAGLTLGALLHQWVLKHYPMLQLLGSDKVRVKR